MNCYLCEKSDHAGGTLYHARPAIGICQRCGVGVCGEHGTKEEEAGRRLVCADCTLSQVKPGRQAA